ncbi:MAG: S9 family peptidase [Acidobacteriota bacterium]|nr:S9 family peptidase [Acidobacteriota bacterium]
MAGSTSFASAQDVQPLTAETLWQMQRLGAPSLSPDGSAAVLPVTRYDVEEDKGYTDLWLIPTDGGEARQLTTHEASDSSPVWSPDGQWIAFVSKRGDDEQSQLYVLPTAGGEARRVTEVPTGVSAPKWFPDSKKLAFISRVWPDAENWEAMAERLKEKEESKVTAQQWDNAIIRWWDHWIDDRQAHLYTVTLDGKSVQPVTLGTGFELDRTGAGSDAYDISPNGDEIAFSADSLNDQTDPDFDIFVVPAGGGEARNLTEDNRGQDYSPLYSPDGKWLAFTRQKINGFYADTLRLVLHDRQQGTNRQRTGVQDWDRSASGLVWAPDSQALYGAIDDAGNRRIYRIDVEGGAPAAITGEKTFSSLAVAGDGPVVVALRQSFLEPPTLVRVDAGSGEATQLSHFNDEVLAEVDFGTYESVTYTGANGDEIQMWINYPPGFDKSKPWPLYLLIHGGPHNGIHDSFHWRWNAQVFSGWGYVTAWHNFHGSSGFGQDFADSINPERAEMPYQDTLAAAQLLADKPWIDGDRMAAGGGSYGGYLTSVILGREHPFKTLIAHAAVYNSFTQYAADYGSGKRRHGEFWESPEVYQRNSPHFGAGNFDTPTLVIHGGQDFRVPLNHGIELYQTLQNRDVESRLIYYPDENHWILKPQNSIHWYHSKEEWLTDHVKPEPVATEKPAEEGKKMDGSSDGDS